MKKLLALLLALVMCVSLLAACGSGDTPSTQGPETQTPETQTPETQPPATQDPEPQVKQDLADYLWEIPEDASLDEKVKLELRNATLIATMEPIFTADSYKAYMKNATSLRSRANEDKLAAALEARADLVQEISVADGIYFIWNDFESMPIVDGESYTEEQLDAASLLGYGYTTVLVKYLIDDPSTAKGNIIMCSGGGMKGRSNGSEGYPAAEAFNALGYNCFLVQRRVEPYSNNDIFMDFARSIRVVRYYAEKEGWGGQDMIAGMGWSGGAMTLMGAVNYFYGDVQFSQYDSDYVPDEIDAVSADLDVAIPVYGGGVLNDGRALEPLPALYIVQGDADMEQLVQASKNLYEKAKELVPAELNMIEGAPHGFGVGTTNDDYPEGCRTWVNGADAFMQANLGHSTAPSYTVEELCFYRDGLKIYGQLAMPEGEGPFPLVILSHGYGGNYRQSIGMAERFAAVGVAAYAFDFNGGGRSSLSEGDSRDMSVLTEAADLNAILDGFAAMPEIDANNIFLCGYSQGGFVSSYVAATRPDDIKALVAYFPAYVIHDDAKEAMPDPDNIPEEIDFMGMTIGRRYYADALSFSIYDLLPNYPNDVLIFHGTKDSLVPIEYSQRAVEVFPSAELVTVEDGAHGNLGNDVDNQAIEFILEHIGN